MAHIFKTVDQMEEQISKFANYGKDQLFNHTNKFQFETNQNELLELNDFTITFKEFENDNNIIEVVIKSEDKDSKEKPLAFIHIDRTELKNDYQSARDKVSNALSNMTSYKAHTHEIPLFERIGLTKFDIVEYCTQAIKNNTSNINYFQDQKDLPSIIENEEIQTLKTFAKGLFTLEDLENHCNKLGINEKILMKNGIKPISKLETTTRTYNAILKEEELSESLKAKLPKNINKDNIIVAINEKTLEHNYFKNLQKDIIDTVFNESSPEYVEVMSVLSNKVGNELFETVNFRVKPEKIVPASKTSLEETIEIANSISKKQSI
jgi:hypothetical protein